MLVAASLFHSFFLTAHLFCFLFFFFRMVPVFCTLFTFKTIYISLPTLCPFNLVLWVFLCVKFQQDAYVWGGLEWWTRRATLLMSFPSGSSFSSYRFISDLVNIKRKKRNTLMYHAVVVRDIKTFFTSFVTFFFLSLSCKPDLLADFFCWLCAIGND